MRLLICGSRDIESYRTVRAAIATLITQFEHEPTTIIHGDARGVDRLAGRYAEKSQIECRAVPANWNEHGKAAGLIRNQKMIDQEKPDMTLAIWDGQSRGTSDMIERSKKAGIPTFIYYL